MFLQLLLTLGGVLGLDASNSTLANSSLSDSTSYSNSSSYSNSTSHPNSSYNYTNSYSSQDFQYQGVALGGWLILEPYITPSLFLRFNETSHNVSDIPNDEYHFCEILGQDEASQRLAEHWATWYNETDFANIKSYGFNMVRIPIGYWAFDMLDDDPYVLGAQDYLDKGIEWAHNNDLKVWIDLHGAPGSQNGFDNLGRFLDNKPQWQNETRYVNLTESVLRQIYEKYGSGEFSEKYGDTVLGIEVLNEPLGPMLSMAKLKQFYTQTYEDARLGQETNNTIVFHDAFQGSGYWDDFKSTSGNGTGRLQNYNILIDHHHYEVFSAGQLNSTIAQRIQAIVDYTSGIQDELDSHPAIVGEWSAALTDCAPWLNSVHYGSRWEGTYPYANAPISNSQISCPNINIWSKWTETHKKNTRKFVEIQLDQYESKSLGWIFWCYKTETTIEWDFVRLSEYGLFPQPFSDRKYIVNGTDTDKTSEGAASRPSFLALLGTFTLLLWF